MWKIKEEFGSQKKICLLSCSRFHYSNYVIIEIMHHLPQVIFPRSLQWTPYRQFVLNGNITWKFAPVYKLPLGWFYIWHINISEIAWTTRYRHRLSRVLRWVNQSSYANPGDCPKSSHYSDPYTLNVTTTTSDLYPLSPRGDWHLIAPCNITTESNIKVTRLRKMITNWRSFSSLKKFSLSVPKQLFRE